MRRRTALLLLPLLLLGAGEALPAEVAFGVPIAFKVLHTADGEGEIAPCG